MEKLVDKAYRLVQFFASIQFAVIVILYLAVVSAVGTIYESKYGADVASLLVYRSPWMAIALFFLSVSIIFSACSRWPWKRNHIAFLVTHLGLVVLIFGSLLTKEYGVDGVIALEQEESTNNVKLPEKRLNVFEALPGDGFRLVDTQALAFNPLKKFSKSYTVTDEPKIEIVDWYPTTDRKVQMEAVANGMGIPGVHFRIYGLRADIHEYLFLNGTQGSTIDLGPAIVRLQKGEPSLSAVSKKNVLFLYLLDKRLHLATVKSGTKKILNMGELQLKTPMALGWMDFHFMLEDYQYSARPKPSYAARTYQQDKGTEVLRLQIGKEKRWLELGASTQIFHKDKLYYLQYVKRHADLNFNIQLKDFRVKYYEGSNKAKSYESDVIVAGQTHSIRMNEPFKYNGFTFYQSSFSTDINGKPTVSILSVNHDPGREVKYLGSLMVVLGILLMFYFKPKYSGNSSWLKRRAVEV